MSRAEASVRALSAARTIVQNAGPGRVVSSDHLRLIALVTGDEPGAEILEKAKTGYVIESEHQAQSIRAFMTWFIARVTQEMQ